MGHLIAAGFDNPHTAFLARAALARLRKDLLLNWHDLAVVIREEGDQPVLLDSARISGEGVERPSFWESLVRGVFDAGPREGASDATAPETLAAIGVDQAFGNDLAERFRANTSALLIFVSGPVISEKLIGVLHGFQGKIVKTQISGGDWDVQHT